MLFSHSSVVSLSYINNWEFLRQRVCFFKLDYSFGRVAMRYMRIFQFVYSTLYLNYISCKKNHIFLGTHIIRPFFLAGAFIKCHFILPLRVKWKCNFLKQFCYCYYDVKITQYTLSVIHFILLLGLVYIEAWIIL